MPASSFKKLVCLDFDGTLHAYTTPWSGADVITDPPVPGAMEFVEALLRRFRVAVFSSRSSEGAGMRAMQAWMLEHLAKQFEHDEARGLFDRIEWPITKPPAHLTLDDRALTFTGTWPSIQVVEEFRPWNKP